MQRLVIVALAALATPALAASVSGTYLAKGDALVDKLEFGPGDKVTATAENQSLTGTYTVAGSQVTIAIPGQTVLVYKLDSAGCLDGGPQIGKLCK